MKKFLVCLTLGSLLFATGCIDKEAKNVGNKAVDGIEAIGVMSDTVGTAIATDEESTGFVGGLSGAFEQLKKIGK